MKTTRQMPGYKVVCRYRSRLWSAMRHGLDCEVITEYAVGEPTIPKTGCGPLAVFTTEAAARYFIDIMFEPTMELWKCTYVASRVRALWGPNGLRVDSHWDHSSYATSVTLTRKAV